jgi:hypothetical protein
MDGSSFDKLSVSVHRLREQASRRNALRLLLGGAAAAATGVAVSTDTDAKKKKKNKKYKKKYRKCRNNFYGGFCNGNKDCCNGKCRNGICWYNGGGGGGGRRCGGTRCPKGWKCRKQGPANICTPNNYPNYCGNNTYWNNNYHCCSGYAGGACPAGWECCPGAGCCGVGQKCCGNGRCCPDGWRCGDIACEYWQEADISSEAVQTQPFTDAIVPDSSDAFVFEPGTAE